MTQTEIQIKRLAVAVQCGVPVFLLGKPGVAKTAITSALARVLDFQYACKIGSQCDPTDFGGMPWVNEQGFVDLKPLSWAYQFSNEQIRDKGGLIFLDELPLAPKSTQDAMLRLVNEGYVGDVKLGKRVARVAAGNDPQHSNTPPMSPMMVNRFCVLEFDMEPQYWCDVAMKGFPDPVVPVVPATWEDYFPESMALVVSYLHRNPTSAHKMPVDESLWGKPWPSYRTWEMSAKLLAATKAAGLGLDISLGLIAGCVGAGEARAFMTFVEQLDLPDPRVVLKDPHAIELPTRGDQLFALVSSVAAYAIANASKEMWLAAWEVMGIAAKIKMDIATQGAKHLSQAYNQGRFGQNMPPPLAAVAIFPTLKLAGIATTASVPKVA